MAAQDFYTLKGHGGPIMDIAVGPSGQIATASFDNSVGLWDGLAPIWREGHRAAVTTVSYDESGTILSGGDDFRVLLWQPAQAEPLEVTEHLGKVSDIAMHPKGDVIASAGWDGFINLTTLREPLQTTALHPTVIETQILKGHRSNVTAVAFAPAGNLFSASSDGTLRIWDGNTSRTLVKHGFGINKLIVTDEWVAYGAVDGGTRLVDINTGTEIADFTLDRRPILSMAFHAPTAQLAVGDG
ncbi:WD domain/Cytochrome c family protein [Sulfitobacter noctilucae]|nr:WD domain/Cytochrome c family protein [Sulfitobacter noctilucae]